MVTLDPVLRLSVVLRSLAVQGSWNYRTMLGAGLGFALLPILTRIYSGDTERLREALRRHTGFFNAHPYLATVAIGAVARLESEDVTDERLARLKVGLIGPLGTLGDRLVWARWRPLCVFLGLLLFVAGAPWWTACLAFLLLYNALHIALRIWGLLLGWRAGGHVGRALLGSPLRRVPDRLTIPLAVVSGALLPLLILGLHDGPGTGLFPLAGIAAALTAVGAWFPSAAGRVTAAGLVLVSLVFAVFGSTAW